MPPQPTNLTEFGALLDVDFTSMSYSTKAAVQPGNTTAIGGSIFSGSGVPGAGLGINGDYYFRTDTPGSANQRLYVKSGGSWVGIL